MGASLQVHRLTKSFGDQLAVAGVDLDVAPGEFVSLLGPSGCGKTTTLRLIAGLEQADTGDIVIDGHQIAGVHRSAARSAWSSSTTPSSPT